MPTRAPGAIDSETLRSHCKTVLAGYKVPKRVIMVAKMPRGPNGKADYAAAKLLAG